MAQKDEEKKNHKIQNKCSNLYTMELNEEENAYSLCVNIMIVKDNEWKKTP